MKIDCPCCKQKEVLASAIIPGICTACANEERGIVLNPEMTKAEVLQEKKSDVVEFFEKLGYEVTWDFNNSGRWWEIMTNHVTFVQIDMGIPLSAILQDFRCFREGKNKGNSEYDYQINVRPDHQKEFEELLEKVVRL